MNLKGAYTLGFFGAVLWLHYVADDPKEMVISGLIAAGAFTMYAVQTVEERLTILHERIDRLWERMNPMRDTDDA